MKKITNLEENVKKILFEKDQKIQELQSQLDHEKSRTSCLQEQLQVLKKSNESMKYEKLENFISLQEAKIKIKKLEEENKKAKYEILGLELKAETLDEYITQRDELLDAYEQHCDNLVVRLEPKIDQEGYDIKYVLLPKEEKHLNDSESLDETEESDDNR